MTNLDSILKSRDINLPTKICIVKAMVFPVVAYGYESWTVRKAEHRRIDAFELWCWRRLLRVSWTARRSNQLVLKEISPEYSLEGLMLKLKCHTLAAWCEELTHWKNPDAGKDWRQEKKGMTEGEMVGWHHRHNGHEFEYLWELVMVREVWRAAFHTVAKSCYRLSNWIEFKLVVQSPSGLRCQSMLYFL